METDYDKQDLRYDAACKQVLSERGWQRRRGMARKSNSL